MSTQRDEREKELYDALKELENAVTRYWFHKESPRSPIPEMTQRALDKARAALEAK